MNTNKSEDVVEKVIVVACSKNQVIGKENTLPWHLPADLQRFKRITLGHPIIMGRKTFDSIGRPLPGRTSFVVTRKKDWECEGVEVCHSLEEAFEKAEREAERLNVRRLMVVGGANFYEQALPLVNRIFLTEIDSTVEGDAFFPELNPAEWATVSEESHCADEKNSIAYKFCELCRI